MDSMINFSTLSIIPARGGSKGIPRKNLHLLGGKPLIAHSIDSAVSATFVHRVIVSTDDAEIARVAREYGSEIVMRPSEISGDTATSESALLHVLEHLANSEGYQPDLVVFLQCTSPLTLPEDIDGTVRMLLEENADTAFAAIPFHYFLWKRDGTGAAQGINHDKEIRLLRQDQEEQFLESGAVYVMRTQGFKETKHRFFGKTAIYVMPPERCLEIDEPVDLRITEILMQEQQKKDKLNLLPDTITALVLDFDGVFTDNRVIVFQDGREAVICNRGDGLGLSRLKKAGLSILVLSSEQNPVVQSRCNKLKISCVQGIDDKLAALRDWLNERKIDSTGVVYIGNDINDLACLNFVGCGIAVSDAHPSVITAANIVLSAPGGWGAIRELTDLMETSRGD